MDQIRCLTVPELRDLSKRHGLHLTGKVNKKQITTRLAIWVRDQVALTVSKENCGSSDNQKDEARCESNVDESGTLKSSRGQIDADDLSTSSKKVAFFGETAAAKPQEFHVDDEKEDDTSTDSSEMDRIFETRSSERKQLEEDEVENSDDDDDDEEEEEDSMGSAEGLQVCGSTRGSSDVEISSDDGSLEIEPKNNRSVPLSKTNSEVWSEDASDCPMMTTLQKLFGHSSFREGQEWTVRRCLDKKRTLLVAPTGFGKSLCYSLPAALMEGVCIVVSPLISLIEVS